MDTPGTFPDTRAGIFGYGFPRPDVYMTHDMHDDGVRLLVKGAIIESRVQNKSQDMAERKIFVL